jgi:hypothetical protein
VAKGAGGGWRVTGEQRGRQGSVNMSLAVRAGDGFEEGMSGPCQPPPEDPVK